MSESGRCTAPVTAPPGVRGRPASRQDHREWLSTISSNGQALKAVDLLAGKVDAKAAAIDTKVGAIDSRAAGIERPLLTLERSLAGRLATPGTRVSARNEDIEAKLIGRVEALSSRRAAQPGWGGEAAR